MENEKIKEDEENKENERIKEIYENKKIEEKAEFVKDFDKWNNYKKLLEIREYSFKFHEGEIWNCYLGENVGYEECGKNDFLRPVLVLRKVSKKGFIGIPTSTKDQIFEEWYQDIGYKEKEKDIKSKALLTQIRFLDARRLSYRKGKIGISQLNEIRRKTAILIKAIEKIDPSAEVDKGFRAISTILFVSLVLILL